jgi:dihydroorotase
LVDPANKVDAAVDLLVAGGKVASIGVGLEAAGARVIDASGLVIAPGLIDIHCHLRFPGFPEKEDLRSGSRAAAAGGFTTLVCLPNTHPVIDSRETVNLVRETAAREAVVNVFPAAAITAGQKGERLTDMDALASDGVPLFSDDGQPIGSPALMREALLSTLRHGRALSVHCEERAITGDGVVNAGPVAQELGVAGIPHSSEPAMVARDIVLAKETGGRLHVDHVSNRLSADVVRFGKSWGANVTAEVTAPALAFTEDRVRVAGANAKVKPPFGSAEDRAALKRALKDGTIDLIVTDHAPHTPEEKARGLAEAPFGLIGLETALGIVLTELVHGGILTLSEAIAKMTVNAARVLVGVDKGHLSIGADADIVVIDPTLQWVADPREYYSKSRNCPAGGVTFNGRAVYTIVGGRVVAEKGKVV